MRIKFFFTCLLSGLTFLSMAQSAPTIARVKKDLTFFSDPLATELRENVQQGDISKITTPQLKAVAQQLLNKTYSTACRLADYAPILAPSTLGKELMIGDGYSKYENITGIYLPVGKHVILAENIPSNNKVGLLVPNWNRRAPQGIDPTKDPAGWGLIRQEFELKNGINIIEIRKFGGLAYIDYFTNQPEKEKPVRVHFVNASVNGYFDLSRDKDADWNRLIDQAVYPVIDARGAHIQIAYPAADCKQFAYNRGVELISNYDSMVTRQHRILGLIKYNKVPKNRILARVNYNYYMFRDEDGVAYMGTNPGNAMPLVVDPARVIKGDPCWGFSHEVGHVHQVRPAFNWGGLGEVSNNIFSLYVTTSFGNGSRISEQKNYQKAKDSIIAKHICYLQDKDVFDRLVPFWQLHLYFNGPGNYKDFYPDLFEAFRQQGAAERTSNPSGKAGGWGDRGSNPAVYQLDFVKTACLVSKPDLTEHFGKYGFFYVGTFKFDDYGPYEYRMTQQMVDECKAAIRAMNFPGPTVDISSMED